MLIAFNNKIQYWGGRLRSGPAGTFVHWWSTELRQSLPVKWQEMMQHALRRVIVSVDSNLLKFGIEENNAYEWVETFKLDEDAALQKQQIRGLIENQEVKETQRFLLLDTSTVLRKTISLPAAAESNLQQVLTFEMDRQTPFRAADVYFTWRSLAEDKENAQIRLELFVVPRKLVDSALDLLNSRGLGVSGVDVLDGNATLGINLLPLEKRVRMVNPKTRLNYALAAAVLVLLIVLMVQSLNIRSSRISDLEAAIAEVQDEARRVQRLREQVVETSEAASFLTRKRAASPLAVDLLASITTTLPDDTYLDRLVISTESILMQGKSSNSQQLIELFNKSEAFDQAAFRGSTRLDNASGLEIFEVNAEIAVPEQP